MRSVDILSKRDILLHLDIVQVFRRPKVAIASTGDELVDPVEGSVLGRGQVRVLLLSLPRHYLAW
jgi:cysteine sulfinate desulfinase/cysteine desulfurase-like protein